MRVYKRTFFAEGINLPLAEFKKEYKNVLKSYSAKEIKEAHAVAIKGNGDTKSTNKKS